MAVILKQVDWMKQEKRKVLITGINGSGASYLAEYIADNVENVEINGTYRQQGNFDNILHLIEKISLHLHHCDLLDQKEIEKTIWKVKPDLIFHIASYANVRKAWDNIPFVMHNNVMSTTFLLEAIHKSKLSPKVLICSTPEVYGQVDPKNIPIDENCPINPNNPYGVSKYAQESLAYSYFMGFQMPVVITRMSTYINPRRSDLFATAFAMQVARIEAGLQVELVHGNLESTRTILDPRDCASAYWLALEKGIPGEVYNIGGDKIVTVGELLDVLKQKAKCPIPSRLDPNLLRPSDTTLQVINSKKFVEQTGWKQQYTFEESVEYLLDHCRRSVLNSSKT